MKDLFEVNTNEGELISKLVKSEGMVHNLIREKRELDEKIERLEEIIREQAKQIK